MQNTISARRVSYNLIVLIVLLVSAALLVGFVVGLGFNKPSSASVSAIVAQPHAPTAGWLYHRDSQTSKWYAYHYATTSTGPVIDETLELQNAPGNPTNGCGLDRAEPDC